MAIFSILYTKDLREFGFRQPKDFEFFDFYEVVASQIYFADVEDAFSYFQGDNPAGWSYTDEARTITQPLIRMLGLHHTSMSVGDCVANHSTGEMFYCDRMGFTKLEMSPSRVASILDLLLGKRKDAQKKFDEEQAHTQALIKTTKMMKKIVLCPIEDDGIPVSF